jgi:phenylpyruvate tautomerase PptA (4-oxalocrotonate tautomerase family)
MPLVKLEMRRGRTADQKRALLEAVHQALMEAFHTPDWDRTQRIVEYAPEDFELPPGKSDGYVLVTITAFAGRSLEAKRALYRAIVSRFAAQGVAPGDVFIVLQESGLENWGVRGGVPASEVELGFQVKV